MKQFLFFFVFFSAISSVFGADHITREQALGSVAKIFVIEQETDQIYASGSGILIDPEKKQIITALHVVSPAISNNSRFDLMVCFNENSAEDTPCYFAASIQSYNEEYDVALVVIDRAFDEETGKPSPLSDFLWSDINDVFPDIYFASLANGANPKIGDSIWIAGYPISGGKTITVSAGILSGMESGKLPYSKKSGVVYYKTDASVNHGNSGGPIFDSNNNFLGITNFVSDDISPLTFGTSWAVIKDLLSNGVAARPGVLCPDYKKMERKNGICTCHEGLEWNDEEYSCQKEDKEVLLKEEIPQKSNSVETFEETEIPQEKEEESSKKKIPKKESKNQQSVLLESEKEKGRKTTRIGILEAISECAPVRKYGDKPAFQKCFRQSFLDFLLSRRTIIKKAKTICIEESTTDLQGCIAEKMR